MVEPFGAVEAGAAFDGALGPLGPLAKLVVVVVLVVVVRAA